MAIFDIQCRFRKPILFANTVATCRLVTNGYQGAIVPRYLLQELQRLFRLDRLVPAG
jgi:hypothetical protein